MGSVVEGDGRGICHTGWEGFSEEVTQELEPEGENGENPGNSIWAEGTASGKFLRRGGEKVCSSKREERTLSGAQRQGGGCWEMRLEGQSHPALTGP